MALTHPSHFLLALPCCLLLLRSLPGASGADPPSGGVEVTIRPSGVSFTRHLGGSMLFTCEGGASDPRLRGRLSVSWTHAESGQEIRDSTGHRYVETDSPAIKKLYITSLRKEDSGIYHCRVHSPEGREGRKSVTLQLFKAITFDLAPSPQHPVAGSDTLVGCGVSGNPAPSVSWRFRGRRIGGEGGGGARYRQEEGGLRIMNVSEADNGEYTCRAEVEADGRYDDRRIALLVHTPPRITSPPPAVEGVEGALAVLHCRAEGYPSPSYSWFHGGRRVGVVKGGRVMANGTTGELWFGKLVREDEGGYSCRAENVVGVDEREGTLLVKVIPAIYDFSNVTTPEGASLMLVCQSTGVPAPNMTLQPIKRIKFDETPSSGAIFSMDGGRIRVVQSAPGKLRLEIRRVLIRDAGNYLCTAHNTVGQDRSTAVVTITYSPRFRPPGGVTKIHAWAGLVRNLTCRSHGVPIPEISWLHRGVPISSTNDTYRIHQNVIRENSNIDTAGNIGGDSDKTGGESRDISVIAHLNEIKEASDVTGILEIHTANNSVSWIYGHYVCVAENAVDRAQKDFELIQATVPAPPLAIIGRLYPDRVDLNVTPPRDHGGVAITGYNLEVRLEYGQVLLEYPAGGNVSGEGEIRGEGEGREGGMVLAVEDLQPGTAFELTVRARNPVGLGRPTYVEVITPPPQVPGRVEPSASAFEAPRDPPSCSLSWARPLTGGFPIDSYQIRWRPLDPPPKPLTDSSGPTAPPTPRGTWHSRTINPPVHTRHISHTIDRLLPDTHYEIQITATNRLGPSPPSAPLYIRTPRGALAPPGSEAATLGGLSPASVAIALGTAVAIIFLVILDVTCYFLHDCGVTRCCCVHVCGRRPSAKSAARAKAKDIEETDSAAADKDRVQEERLISASTEESAPRNHAPASAGGEGAAEGAFAPRRAAAPPEDSEPPLSDEKSKLLLECGSDDRPPSCNDDDESDVIINKDGGGGGMTADPPVPAKRMSLAGSNRKSILSQGDERWRVVVKELERELGVQKGGEEEATRPVIRLPTDAPSLRRLLNEAGDVGEGVGTLERRQGAGPPPGGEKCLTPPVPAARPSLGEGRKDLGGGGATGSRGDYVKTSLS